MGFLTPFETSHFRVTELPFVMLVALAAKELIFGVDEASELAAKTTNIELRIIATTNNPIRLILILFFIKQNHSLK
jgi:hypothetical protein